MTRTTSLSDEFRDAQRARLRAAHEQVIARYPVDRGDRQPVHTVYGGAHLFKATTAHKLGAIALSVLDTYGGSPTEFVRAIGVDCDDATADTLVTRVRDKLAREPVEDFRIDFEDGYGHRSDDEEDGHAERAALEVARGIQDGTLPPFYGIRIKPLSAELGARSLRTLDLFVTALSENVSDPGRVIVTLPKITHPDQVSVLADVLDELEFTLGIKSGSLAIELMIETTQAIFGADGASSLPGLVARARGRCTGAHFGTYDYTASCGVISTHQDMTHRACDFARHMMQVAYAGTGVFLSDGATNIMPVAPHRRVRDGAALTPAQVAENRATVHAAWNLHVADIRHSLVHAFYQGWDLHPAQLPTRYAAVYAFFLGGLRAASERLTNFIDAAAQATLVGDVFDDAATGQGLLNLFIRGVNCGAITEREALATGLTFDELRGRSFVAILNNRRAARSR